MKLAIYGGSFNPPHLGHVHAVRCVLETLQPDRFLVIPDNLPPHKELSSGSPSPEDRLALCRLAFQDLPGVEVSDLELRRSGKSYTSDTVSALRVLYPDDSFYLVIGSDMLLCFRQWVRYRYLLAECTLAVLSREGGDSEQLQKVSRQLIAEEHARIILIPCIPFPASSTEIRMLLARREYPSALDDAVYQAILEKHFYI